MKCPVCKYLNVREEARKHLNEVTLRNLGLVTQGILSLEAMVEGAVQSNCLIHQNADTLSKHAISIAQCATAIANLVKENPAGVPASKLKAVMSQYPHPGK